MFMMIIQNNIFRLRVASGLSQEELARLTGVSFSAINSWERGAKVPLLTGAYALASALGVSVYEIWPKVNFSDEK